MLREVVESARSLTGARFGALASAIDEAGAPQDFVTSGFTEAEHRAMVEWSDGPRLFEHFRDRPGPLRIADVSTYVQGLGFPTDRLPSKTFQGTPMRHRGVHVGNFYLVEKEGGEAFTDEDEEILVLFASQAATAINQCAHLPRRAAGAGRPRGADRDLAGRRRRVRRRHRPPGLAQPPSMAGGARPSTRRQH